MDEPRSGSQWFSLTLPPQCVVLGRALLLSTLAMTLLVAIVSVVIVPRSQHRLYDSQAIAITHAVIDEPAGQALVLFRTMPSSPAGAFYRVGVQDLRRPFFSPRTLSTAESPSCLVATPKGVVVGFADGTLRQFSSAWQETSVTASNSEFIGQQLDGAPSSLACSNDGRHVISYDSNSIYVWDLPGKRLKHRLARGEAFSFVWAPHGDTFYHDLRGCVVERSAATGEVLRIVDKCHEHVVALALSADGRLLASLGMNRELRVVQTVDGRFLWKKDICNEADQSLLGAGEALPALSPALVFNADGQLASASDHGTFSQTWLITLWDANTGRRQLRFTAHRNLILGIAFGARKLCYSWGSDGTLRTWDLTAIKNST